MKFTRQGSTDWVEIEGADELAMRELTGLFDADAQAAYTIAAGVVTDWQFSRKGQPVGRGPDGRLDVAGLTAKQYDWLRKRIVEAARAEALDPEA